MGNADPGPALDLVRRIEQMCDFFDSPAIMRCVSEAVTVTMPRAPGALGFDIPLWVGLGTVGLWAAVDAFAERAGWRSTHCRVCGTRSCVWARHGEVPVLAELEDLRHLHAHNYGGVADAQFFARPRHVLTRDVAVQLLSGGHFDGRRVHLELAHLRAYAVAVRAILSATV